MQPEQVASPERCRAKRNKNREAGRKGTGNGKKTDRAEIRREGRQNVENDIQDGRPGRNL